MAAEMPVPKEKRWTPGLIRRLRGKRSQSEFGALVGATTNTIWRWEGGRVRPDEEHARRLSDLAKLEGFLKEWKLMGSCTLVGDIETGSRKLSEDLRQTLENRGRRLLKS